MERIVALDATGTTPFLLTGQQHTPASEVMVIDPTLSYRWALDYQYIRKDQGTLKVVVECFSDVEGTQRIEDNRRILDLYPLDEMGFSSLPLLERQVRTGTLQGFQKMNSEENKSNFREGTASIRIRLLSCCNADKKQDVVVYDCHLEVVPGIVIALDA